MSGFKRNTGVHRKALLSNKTSGKSLRSSCIIPDKLCIWLLMRSHFSMSWLEFRLPCLLPLLSHFPQLSWIRGMIYLGTCARGFISCSLSVLINGRGLLTCLTPDGTLCLLWHNSAGEERDMFWHRRDRGVRGHARVAVRLWMLCICLCNSEIEKWMGRLEKTNNSAISHALLLEKYFYVKCVLLSTDMLRIAPRKF